MPLAPVWQLVAGQGCDIWSHLTYTCDLDILRPLAHIWILVRRLSSTQRIGLRTAKRREPPLQAKADP